MLKLFVDWCWHHTNTCSEITKCIVEVLVSDRAINSGTSWILLLPWWYIEDGRTTFFCQLDNLSGGQWCALASSCAFPLNCVACTKLMRLDLSSNSGTPSSTAKILDQLECSQDLEQRILARSFVSKLQQLVASFFFSWLLWFWWWRVECTKSQSWYTLYKNINIENNRVNLPKQRCLVMISHLVAVLCNYFSIV